MISNNANFVLKQINILFAKSLQGRDDAEIKRFVEFVKSENATEEYLLFDALSGVEEWIDTINWGGMKAFSYQIKNKSWVFGAPFKKEIIEDAKTNSVLPQIQRFVEEGCRNWVDFPAQLIHELVIANGLAFDGTNFFANSRPELEGSNTINNIVAGTGTAIENVYADLNTAIDRLYTFKSKNNRAYNRGGKILCLIPPHLRSIFSTLKNADQVNVTGIGANALKDGFDFMINFEQSITDNDYYVINENAVMKPFIFQTRQEPRFEVVDEADNPFIKYFSTARSNAGYGNPMSIVKVNN